MKRLTTAPNDQMPVGVPQRVSMIIFRLRHPSAPRGGLQSHQSKVVSKGSCSESVVHSSRVDGLDSLNDDDLINWITKENMWKQFRNNLLFSVPTVYFANANHTLSRIYFATVYSANFPQRSCPIQKREDDIIRSRVDSPKISTVWWLGSYISQWL